jgi:hypothetical protein
VLETRVEVGFGREQHHMLEVSVVNVGVDSEKTFEYHFDNVDEVTWKWDAQLARKNFFVVQLGLYPSHQKINVLSGAHL